MLAVRRSVERMSAVEEGMPEQECGSCVPSGRQDQMDLDVDGPRDDDPPAEGREKAHSEVVAALLPTIAR